MPTAILIGFEYIINSLPGSYIDIFHSYNWCDSFNCDIYIITDVDYNINKSNIIQGINNNIIDKNIHFLDTHPKIIINNSLDLCSNIKTILNYGIPDNKLIIYYSGHGINNNMLMPNNTYLSFDNFKSLILSDISSSVEIFFILDCCNPNGLSLPYKLDDNYFKLVNNNIDFIPHSMLLITSSNENEKSLATIYGSVFSKFLFEILTQMNTEYPLTMTDDKILINKHNNRNLRRLIGNIKSSIRKLHTGFSQSVSVYSSFIIDPLLWMWIGSNREYDIKSETTLSTLIIKYLEMP
jgi:hypothetical protein